MSDLSNMERVIKLRAVMRSRFTRNYYNALQKQLLNNKLKEVKATFNKI